jgi:hypothetical protein
MYFVNIHNLVTSSTSPTSSTSTNPLLPTYHPAGAHINGFSTQTFTASLSGSTTADVAAGVVVVSVGRVHDGVLIVTSVHPS